MKHPRNDNPLVVHTTSTHSKYFQEPASVCRSIFKKSWEGSPGRAATVPLTDRMGRIYHLEGTKLINWASSGIFWVCSCLQCVRAQTRTHCPYIDLFVVLEPNLSIIHWFKVIKGYSHPYFSKFLEEHLYADEMGVICSKERRGTSKKICDLQEGATKKG